jgi:hypothetical protein
MKSSMLENKRNSFSNTFGSPSQGQGQGFGVGQGQGQGPTYYNSNRNRDAIDNKKNKGR